MVMGNNNRVIMGPGRGGKLFAIVALVPDEKMKVKSIEDSWVKPGSKPELLMAYADFPVWQRPSSSQHRMMVSAYGNFVTLIRSPGG
jgi:hypothetical protein